MNLFLESILLQSVVQADVDVDRALSNTWYANKKKKKRNLEGALSVHLHASVDVADDYSIKNTFLNLIYSNFNSSQTLKNHTRSLLKVIHAFL